MKPIFAAILLSFVATITSDDYDTWHQRRIESLKSEDGWLNLAGLFWLNEGDNSFGSAASNALVFPEKSPKKLGVLTLKGGKVSLKTQKGVDIELKNAAASSEYVFENGKAIAMQHGALRWFIIKRGPKYGVRLRDLANPVVAQFKGVERFAVREDWKITATFEAPQTPKTIAMNCVKYQVLGQIFFG